MKRYIRLLATYVVIAVVAVLLYAPWFLALRPWDYSILHAGSSIVAAIGLVGTFFVSTYLTLKEPEVKLLEPANIMSEDEVLPLLQGYVETPYVGGIAADAIDQVKSAARKRNRLRKIIGMQFSEGSISWDKFSGLVDTAGRTVLRNAALVANNVQSFDREGYAKARAQAKREGSSQLREESISLYENTLADMQEIVDANERVLLEMGKLELELSKLESDDTRESASQTVEELQALIEDTRYYR